MKLFINGNTHQIEAPIDMPLLWVLRDLLDFKDTKFGCGVGACGACTVLVDGIPTRSCIVAASDVTGKITTIEGIRDQAQLHKVQEAWIKHEVPQCGYCQSGQILTAVALLAKIPQPSDADIDAEMTNLCRCGSYPRLRAAIHEAAGMGE